MKSRIETIHAMEILDSRGNPTLAVSVTLEGGARGTASVPSGASTGIHEALELRDGDPRRYNGKGVLRAVANVNKTIFKALKGRDVTALEELDNTMRILDGTENKHVLGANAILGVSMACAHAGAKVTSLPLYKYLRGLYSFQDRRFHLPTPLMNVFNGGLHADTNLDIQEFIIIPHAFPTFARKLQAGVEVFHALHDVLQDADLDTDVGNEGGYAPDVGKTTDALDFLVTAIKKAKYKPGKEISLGMDIAASEFFDARTGKYHLRTDGKKLSGEGMTEMIGDWMKKYPLLTIEDPLDQDAWEDWSAFTKMHGDKLTVIGDDFYVTNVERLARGIETNATNAILIKMNQIGTVSETMDTIRLAKEHGQKLVISHRSGETGDATIADLAVAVNAQYIKTGAPSRSERLAKYNRLLEIEEELH